MSDYKPEYKQGDEILLKHTDDEEIDNSAIVADMNSIIKTVNEKL